MSSPHAPVLLDEVLEGLSVSKSGVYVDGTFGAGGYSSAILEAGIEKLYAIDRDPSVEVYAQPLRDKYGARFTLLEGRFSDMVSLLKAQQRSSVSGIVLDIGTSSMQLDQAERGFSFMADAPLDMRMSMTGLSAFDLVNEAEVQELARIFRQYGDERLAKRIANRIDRARKESPVETTLQLRAIVRSAVGGKNELSSTARVFQALRIAVNDELEELRDALVAAEILLEEGGRLCVVTFHSGEDRIVKRFLAERTGKTAQVRTSRHVPDLPQNGPQPSFLARPVKAIIPTPEEIKANPRSRSAKLRVAERTGAPAWGQQGGEEV